MITSLPAKCSLFQRDITVKIISKSITHKMAAEAIWHATVEWPSLRPSVLSTNGNNGGRRVCCCGRGSAGAGAQQQMRAASR